MELIMTASPILEDSTKTFTKKFKKHEATTRSVVSLFSGGGGMDLGLEGGFQVLKKSVNTDLHPEFVDEEHGKFVKLKKTKFRTVFANDIFDSAKTSWSNYFKKRGHEPEIFRSESIVDLVKLHRSGKQVFPKNVDVVTGGFPCQDFSLSGLRNGFKSHKDHNGKIIETKIPTEETRGKLYMWMKQVIEITQPKIFIAENVKGLMSLGDVVKIIRSDFSSAGYIVFAKTLHSADFGVPQSRERVIFIGVKKSALKPIALKKLQEKTIDEDYYPFPSPTHSYTTEGEDLWPFVAVKEVFKNLPEPEQSGDPSQRAYSRAKFMGKHCQGQSEVRFNGLAPTIRSEHHGNIEFRRLSAENGGVIVGELNKGKAERRLTVRECALIQTFPPDYDFVIPKAGSTKFHLSPSEAYKVIGNAVPPLLAYNIGQRIQTIWNKYFNE